MMKTNLVDVVLVVVDPLHIIEVAQSIADSVLSDNDRRVVELPAHPGQESSDTRWHDAQARSRGEPGGGGGEGHPHVRHSAHFF